MARRSCCDHRCASRRCPGLCACVCRVESVLHRRRAPSRSRTTIWARCCVWPPAGDGCAGALCGRVHRSAAGDTWVAPRPGAGGVLTMLFRVQLLDRALMRQSFRARSPRLDGALVGVGRAASYSRLWLLIAGGLTVAGGTQARRAASRGVAAIAIASAAANGPAKLLARRRRPFSRSRPPLIPVPRSTSFPSGHSASAFAFATAACGELPWLAPALVPLAGAVAYSRVHAGVHYPSDVAAGAAPGVACRAGALRTPPHGHVDPGA